MKKKNLMLLAILLLGVGFAVVSTTLYLNGNVKIATNNADFDVKFTKAVLDGTDVSADIIPSDGKTITFSTKDLSTVNDISKLDFEVTNNSAMYDANVSIECTAAGDKSSYYEITKEVTSSIPGKTTGIGKVEVKLLKASVEDFSETFTCTLSSTAKERIVKAEIPIYYAFGDPLTVTDKIINYATLKYPADSDKVGAGQQAKVFVKLDGVQKSVCIVKNDSLECFKNNSVDEEQKHVREVFSNITCTRPDSDVSCDASDFSCYVSSSGYIRCRDEATSFYCYLSSAGSVTCG